VLDLKSLIFHKFNRYLLGGVISYGLKLGITAFLTEILGWWYFRSYITAISSVIIFNFFFAVYVVFKATQEKTKKFVAYTCTVCVFYALDVLSVKFLTEFIKLHYMVSIIIITSILLVVKFFVYERWVFR